jgi:hypothetical protein
MMKSRKRPIKDRMTEARRTGAILALMTCPKIEDAAKLAKVGRTTLFRWMNDPTFAAELATARSTAFTSGLNVVKGAVEQAAGVLVALLGSRKETERRLAAMGILDISMRLHEGDEVEARFVRLEKAVAAGGVGGGAAAVLHFDYSLTEPGADPKRG